MDYLPAFIENLSPSEKRGELAYVAALIADRIATRHALNNGYEELNPLYGKHPSDGALALSGILGALGHAYLTSKMPEKYRPLWQNLSIGLETGLTLNNLKLGGKLNF